MTDPDSPGAGPATASERSSQTVTPLRIGAAVLGAGVLFMAALGVKSTFFGSEDAPSASTPGSARPAVLDAPQGYTSTGTMGEFEYLNSVTIFGDPARTPQDYANLVAKGMEACGLLKTSSNAVEAAKTFEREGMSFPEAIRIVVAAKDHLCGTA